MQCIKCRVELPDGAVYCPACGKKQTPQQRKALKRPNGTGTVYKLSGRRKRPWVASKARIVIGYYETKTEALQALERVSEQTITDKYNMTFAEVYQVWSVEHFSKIAERATGSLLLSGYEGNKLVSNFRKRDYARLLERLGIPYKVPYTARHTYGSRSVKGGMAPENLKQIMGHTDYTTTVNNYISADVDELIAAAESASVTNTLLTNEKRSKNSSSKS